MSAHAWQSDGNGVHQCIRCGVFARDDDRDPPPPCDSNQADRDLLLLAKIRAHPNLDAVMRTTYGGSGGYRECAAMIHRLLSGGSNGNG